MIRGTRIIKGNEAIAYRQLTNAFRDKLTNLGFEEVIFPALWEQKTFTDKAGPEIVNQMYAFPDKKGREICLIPEVTALVEETWNNTWKQEKKKPYAIFYEAKCYRYERPQEGRYREFNQFGVEILGGDETLTTNMIRVALTELLAIANVHHKVTTGVKRGLDYYTADGFEVECPVLGAQKQVLGGGRYSSGIGFAFGMDRLLLAIKKGQ